MWTTNGIGFTHGPSPRNRLPMSHVKVLSDGSTRVTGESIDAPLVAARRLRRSPSPAGAHPTRSRVGFRGFFL
jgi:hypothetical protein